MGLHKIGEINIMHQTNFAHKLRELDKNDDFKSFRSLHPGLAWLTHTRSDLCGYANILSQVTEDTYRSVHIKLINAAVGKLQDWEK